MPDQRPSATRADLDRLAALLRELDRMLHPASTRPLGGYRFPPAVLPPLPRATTGAAPGRGDSGWMPTRTAAVGGLPDPGVAWVEPAVVEHAGADRAGPDRAGPDRAAALSAAAAPVGEDRAAGPGNGESTPVQPAARRVPTGDPLPPVPRVAQPVAPDEEGAPPVPSPAASGPTPPPVPIAPSGGVRPEAASDRRGDPPTATDDPRPQDGRAAPPAGPVAQPLRNAAATSAPSDEWAARSSSAAGPVPADPAPTPPTAAVVDESPAPRRRSALPTASEPRPAGHGADAARSAELVDIEVEGIDGQPEPTTTAAPSPLLEDDAAAPYEPDGPGVSVPAPRRARSRPAPRREPGGLSPDEAARVRSGLERSYLDRTLRRFR